VSFAERVVLIALIVFLQDDNGANSDSARATSLSSVGVWTCVGLIGLTFILSFVCRPFNKDIEDIQDIIYRFATITNILIGGAMSNEWIDSSSKWQVSFMLTALVLVNGVTLLTTLTILDPKKLWEDFKGKYREFKKAKKKSKKRLQEQRKEESQRLIKAAFDCNVSAVEKLLEQENMDLNYRIHSSDGGNDEGLLVIDDKENTEGWTALFAAIAGGSPEVVKMLLRHGASIPGNEK